MAACQDRFDSLNRLNFTWDALDTQWWEKYDQLEAFHAKEGHCRVPRKGPTTQLECWVVAQRRNDSLSQDRIDALNRLNFTWNA